MLLFDFPIFIKMRAFTIFNFVVIKMTFTFNGPIFIICNKLT
ncbi:hypothetical protein SF123566_0633, partial [Shigella flexneri 1235-66]